MSDFGGKRRARAKDLVFFARYYRYNLWQEVRMRVGHWDVLREHREVMRKVRGREGGD